MSECPLHIPRQNVKAPTLGPMPTAVQSVVREEITRHKRAREGAWERGGDAQRGGEWAGKPPQGTLCISAGREN